MPLPQTHQLWDPQTQQKPPCLSAISSGAKKLINTCLLGPFGPSAKMWATCAILLLLRLRNISEPIAPYPLQALLFMAAAAIADQTRSASEFKMCPVISLEWSCTQHTVTQSLACLLLREVGGNNWTYLGVLGCGWHCLHVLVGRSSLWKPEICPNHGLGGSNSDSVSASKQSTAYKTINPRDQPANYQSLQWKLVDEISDRRYKVGKHPATLLQPSIQFHHHFKDKLYNLLFGIASSILLWPMWQRFQSHVLPPEARHNPITLHQMACLLPAPITSPFTAPLRSQGEKRGASAPPEARACTCQHMCLWQLFGIASLDFFFFMLMIMTWWLLWLVMYDPFHGVFFLGHKLWLALGLSRCMNNMIDTVARLTHLEPVTPMDGWAHRCGPRRERTATCQRPWLRGPPTLQRPKVNICPGEISLSSPLPHCVARDRFEEAVLFTLFWYLVCLHSSLASSKILAVNSGSNFSAAMCS